MFLDLVESQLKCTTAPFIPILISHFGEDTLPYKVSGMGLDSSALLWEQAPPASLWPMQQGNGSLWKLLHILRILRGSERKDIRSMLCECCVWLFGSNC